MRPSPQRHTLAVLRTFLGLTQKEMAELAECSRPTIQAVELGKLKLSYDLAQRIHFETGIRLDWLLANDVNAPLLDDAMKPYTKAAFEERQAALLSPARNGEVACLEFVDLWTLFTHHVKLLSLVYTEAYKQGKVGIVAYKSMMAIAELAKTTLKAPDIVADKYFAGIQEEPSPEQLNQVAGTVQEFAAETFEELKRKFQQRKQPIPSDVKKFLREIEKGLKRPATG